MRATTDLHMSCEDMQRTTANKVSKYHNTKSPVGSSLPLWMLGQVIAAREPEFMDKQYDRSYH